MSIHQMKRRSSRALEISCFKRPRLSFATDFRPIIVGRWLRSGRRIVTYVVESHTFLYDWWPLLRVGHIYEKLSRVPVELCKPASKQH